MVLLVFSLVAAIAGLLMLISTYSITSYLDDRGIEIKYSLLRSKFWGYLRQYKKMTSQNSGKVGSFFYIFWISFALGVLWLVGVVIVAVV